jgi:hypothetical protein
MTTVALYNLFLDSKYRTSGTNSSPEFALPSPITLSNPNHRFIVTVKSADVPFSFKSLSTPYNTLRVQYIETPFVNAFFTITVPPGNYSITQLLSILSSLLTAGIAPLATNAPQFNFSYDRNTGLATLDIQAVTPGNPTTVRLFWTDPNGDFLANFFGFTGDIDTILSYNGAGVPSYTNNVSEGHVICSPISSIYIRSGTLSQPANNDEYLVEFSGTVSDILLKMSVTTPYNTWLNYSNGDIEITINNKLIDIIQLYITGLSYIPLDLSNVYWRTHLQIKEIRDTYLDEIEKEQQRIAQEIRQLEMERERAMMELDGASAEMRQNLPELQKSAEEPLLDEKAQLLQEIEQNRMENVG